MQKEMSTSIHIAVIGCICAVIFGAFAYLVAFEYGLGWSAATLVALASAILGGGVAWLAYSPHESWRGIRRAWNETIMPGFASAVERIKKTAPVVLVVVLYMAAIVTFLAVTWGWGIPLLAPEAHLFGTAASSMFLGLVWAVFFMMVTFANECSKKHIGLRYPIRNRKQWYRRVFLTINPPWHHPSATLAAASRNHQRQRVEMWLRVTFFLTLLGAIYVLGWLVVQTLIALPRFCRFVKDFSFRAVVNLHNDARRAVFLSTFYGVLVGVCSGYLLESLPVCIALCAIVGALSGPLLYRSAQRAASCIENHALA